MSSAPIEIHSAASPEISDQSQPDLGPPVGAADGLEVVIHELQQRELLAPLLLLSSGYVALPLILQHLLLLLTPIAAILGLSLTSREEAP